MPCCDVLCSGIGVDQASESGLHISSQMRAAGGHENISLLSIGWVQQIVYGMATNDINITDRCEASGPQTILCLSMHLLSRENTTKLCGTMQMPESGMTPSRCVWERSAVSVNRPKETSPPFSNQSRIGQGITATRVCRFLGVFGGEECLDPLSSVHSGSNMR